MSFCLVLFHSATIQQHSPLRKGNGRQITNSVDHRPSTSTNRGTGSNDNHNHNNNNRFLSSDVFNVVDAAASVSTSLIGSDNHLADTAAAAVEHDDDPDDTNDDFEETASRGSLGIPGTTQTESGYDTELGTDPICWETQGHANHADPNSVLFENYLIQDYRMSDQVRLLSRCPRGNYLTGYAPPPLKVYESYKLRTGQWYNYTVNATLDIASMGGNVFVSDFPYYRVSFQVIVCTLGKAGFCSPFIHDESNARLEAQGIFETPDTGDSHGGTHVHSPRVFVPLKPQDGPIYKLENVRVPMLVNVPGKFFTIVAIQMFVSNSSDVSNMDESINSNTVYFNITTRYDMANALAGDPILSYQDPPNIMFVSMPVHIICWVIIGFSTGVLLYLLCNTVKYRNHQVLQLTQAPFLIMFLVAAIMTILCSALLEPASDVHCMYGDVLVLIGLQFVYAITLGRLWRINAVISPLLMQTMHRKQTWNTRLVTSIKVLTAKASRCSVGVLLRNESNGGASVSFSKHKSKNLRRTVTCYQLFLVVMSFVLPQIVIGVLAITLQPETLTILYNSDESMGRATCDNGLPVSQSLVYYGFYLFLLLVVALVVLAAATNALPSLFNETRVICESAMTSLLLLVLGLGVLFVTTGPTTSPDVEYFVWVLVIASMTLNMALRTMLPKLQMVWRNEIVLVSKLVSDHARSVRDSQSGHSSRNGPRISGLEPPHRQSTMRSNSIECQDELNQFQRDEVVNSGDANSVPKFARNNEVELTQDLTESDTHMPSPTSSSRDVTGSSSPDANSSPIPTKAIVGSNSERPNLRKFANALPSRRRPSTPHISRRITVKKSETPARRLLLKMVDLQEHLGAVNERIISGLAVTEDDWEMLRRLSGRLGDTFRQEVMFEWESSESFRRQAEYDYTKNTSSIAIGGPDELEANCSAKSDSSALAAGDCIPEELQENDSDEEDEGEFFEDEVCGANDLLSGNKEDAQGACSSNMISANIHDCDRHRELDDGLIEL